MSKETQYSNYPNLIFREVFSSEQETRKNGGVPTDVDFSGGKGSFNGTSSKVNYSLGLNGTYSVRIRCNPASFALYRYLIDVRGSNNDGAGAIYLDITTGNLATTSGTAYINSEVGVSLSTDEDVEIMITGITLTEGTGSNKSLIGSNLWGASIFLGTIDLFEIYEGTLTASEVANLYHDKWNTEQVFSGSCKSDVVINGGFDTDTDWGKQAGWSISNGKANCDGTQSGTSGIYQPNTGLVNGKKYKIIYTISNYSAGTIGIGTVAAIIGTTRDSNGTYVEDIIWNNASDSFYLYGSSTFIGSIDNVTIQEISPKTLIDFDSTQGSIKDNMVGSVVDDNLLTNGTFDTDTDWNKGANTTISGGTLNFVNKSGVSSQNCGVETGKKYLVSYEITSYTSGDMRTYIGTTGVGTRFSTVGVHSEIVEHNGTGSLFYFFGDAFTGSIDNVSVTEVRSDIVNTDTTITKTGSNYAAKFNGSTSKLDLGTDMIGTKAITIIGWVNPYGWGEGITGRVIDNGKTYLWIETTGRFGFTSDNISTAYSNISEVILSKLIYVAITREIDGTTTILKGDLDTAPVDITNTSASGTPVAGDTNVIIGNKDAGNVTWDGLILKLKVVEGILSLAEITREWSSTRWKVQ